MDFCYKKSMGNGTITSKFRLSQPPTTIIPNQSNLRTIISEIEESKVEHSIKSPEIETKETHHPSNCNRCYKLKKKCSRTYPKCSHCQRTGVECEYVNRSKKRKKEIEGQVLQISKPDLKQGVTSHKLISVSSLLSDEPEPTKRKITKKRMPTAALASSARRAKQVDRNLIDRINYNSITTSSTTNLNEEFITLKAINISPIIFALNYFENYTFKYPFLNKDKYLQKLSKVDFAKESIVNLDLYLLLSIGCLLYDSKCGTNYYSEIFKEKSVLSIIDVLNFSFSEYNKDALKLLLLLTIFGINSMNGELVWNLIGMLNRAVIKFEIYKKGDDDDDETRRIFWSIHNLDKEYSLLSKKPSQFPNYKYITQGQIESPLYENENISLINHNITLCKFQDSILDLLLTNSNENLSKISGDVGKWSSTTTKEIRQKFIQQPDLQDLIPWLYFQSFYLQAELDSLSTTKSIRFSSQFIFYSFTLMILGSDKSEKPNYKISISSSLFWYAQLFNVLNYSINTFIHFLETEEEDNLRVKIVDFNSYLHQLLNILKYVSGRNQDKINQEINNLITNLDDLSIQLMSEDKNSILTTCKRISLYSVI
ncbi:unnamed protein product [Candida verbasci]|uniref:Zn(2)-C6 fungal-type domain-containing protein n=1 Tax=Candida verbasci TaxID=1227364 RepID=A0A9W4TWJ7_9ASCO|nr:unnamed protein product [Candida verbasci]